MTRFIIAYHISLVDISSGRFSLDVKQLKKSWNFIIFIALWDAQGKIKMYYGMSKVKKQISGKSLL